MGCCSGKPEGEPKVLAGGGLGAGEWEVAELSAESKVPTDEEVALLEKLAGIDAGSQDSRRHNGARGGEEEKKITRSVRNNPGGNFEHEGPDIPACLAFAAVQLQMAYPASKRGSSGIEAPVSVPVGNMHCSGGYNGKKGAGGAVVCRVHAFGAFREIRKSCGIVEEEFLNSLTDVKEIGNPGKGGQRLFATGDKKYFLKSMAGIELTMLEHILNPPKGLDIEKYTEHMERETLLCKFVGWLSVDTEDEVTWLVAMCNILPSRVCGQEKLMQFDLKG